MVEEKEKEEKKKDLRKLAQRSKEKMGKRVRVDVTVACRMQGVPVGGLAMRVGWTEEGDEQGWRKAGVAEACG